MSLQMETPGGGLAGFWAKMTGGSRRRQPMLRPAHREDHDMRGTHRPAWRQDVPSRRDVSSNAHPASKNPVPISDERAAEAQVKRRAEISAEELFRFFISEMKGGDYAYRILKNEFDELCAEAKLPPLSEYKFPRWLQASGGVSYRTGHDKITMYKMPRRRRAAAA